VLFKLVIRDNLRNTADDFEAGDVRAAETVPYRVGADPACACVVEPQGAPGPYFTIAAGDAEGTYSVVPDGRVAVFLNQSPLTTAAPLHSGDELRVGHLTLKFERVYRSVGQGRRADTMTLLAKVLLGIIFFCEVFLVYWLPNQVKSSRILAGDRIRQTTAMRLDALRGRAQVEPTVPEGEIERSARRLATEELNALAAFVRGREKELSPDQWLQVRNHLDALARILDRLDAGPLASPLPAVDVEGGVRTLLEQSGEKP